MKYFIAGGAGFIGSHLTKKLLSRDSVEKITVYDNFSSGSLRLLGESVNDKRLTVLEADISKLDTLVEAMKGHDIVYHLASNPDIARAVTEPDIDFWQGTYLTQNVVEAMRRTGVKRIVYSSGSGVYGELGEREVFEDLGPLLPISTYGASKLAGEALICSYSHIFDIQGFVFRFANVIGPNQTHGVGLDFLKRLKQDPTQLRILGDGSQSKSYIHVEDILAGIDTAMEMASGRYNVFNLATGDYITVSEIAALAVGVMGLSNVKFNYTGGDRGWKGDIPVVRINTDRIRSLGWVPKRNTRQAMLHALQFMKAEMDKS